MTAGERSPRPGAAWDEVLLRGLEVVVDDDRGESPFGWAEPQPVGYEPTATVDGPSEPPRLNRAQRRRIAKANRRGRA